MPKAEKMLDEMEEILDQLIVNAEKLYEISLQVIVEEELSLLQKKQQELLSALVALDESFSQRYGFKDHISKHQDIQAKLELFEKLNADFIKNISSSHGLIQFESGKKSRKGS